MRYQHDNGPPMFTYAALAAYVAFFAAQYKGFDLSNFYAFPWRVADGELWRLITPTFLHGGFLHIAFNLSLFIRLMPVIDNWLGPWGALGVYVLCAIPATAAQLLVSDPRTYYGVVGASGVVYGLFGFLWVMSRRRDDAAEAVTPHVVQTMIVWLGVCFVVNMFRGNIGNTAHLVGLLFGWLLGQIVVARKKHHLPLILATAAGWVLLVALTYRPVWKQTLAHLPFFGSWYGNEMREERRAAIEHPENAPQVGLFSTRRR